MICSENSKDLKIYLILQNIALRFINYLIVSVFVLFLSYYFELSASAGYSLAMTLCLCLSVCLSVCHKPVFCRNGWTDRAGF